MRSAALSPLFSSDVIVTERREPGDRRDLLPEEIDYVARARPKRIQEFAAGRACAREALAQFGVHGFAVHAAADRRPLWPVGYVGSITHTRGLGAAAVAERRHFLALGLDSELVGAPTPDIWPTLCRGEELAWVGALPQGDRSAAVTLVFSAKEAFYKCQYPLAGEWLDFHDLVLQTTDWGPRGTFTLDATRPIRFGAHAALPITGRYVFHEEFVSAGVAVPARHAQ